jgi:hypothetical protein
MTQHNTEFTTTHISNPDKPFQPDLTDWLIDRLAAPGQEYAHDLFKEANLELPEDDTHALHKIYWALVSHHNMNRVTKALSQLGSKALQDENK